MDKVTMIGCDLHDRSVLVQTAVDSGKPTKKSFARTNLEQMVDWFKEFAGRHGSTRIVLAYEASGLGFGLYDALTEAGIECYVLAPTHLPRSSHRRRNKTDEKDALMILDEVRGHVLAGRKLPAVWIPDAQTRDDREIVRMRLQLGADLTRIKNQIRTLAKRAKLEFPPVFTRSGDWSRRSLHWLRDVAAGKIEHQGEGVRTRLASLVDLYEALRNQRAMMDKALAKLADSDRYRQAHRKLRLLEGVGTLTAMVFLTELGDLSRFNNRRQLSAYLGLCPSAFESGEINDRKGPITRQGSAHVRHVLCQASWAALRCSKYWRQIYDQVKRGSSKRSKVAIVAVMRRLAILMWHTARSAALDELFESVDQERTSARAQQKGAAPSVLAAAST